MTIEIVDFPIENGGSFHSFLYVYQRVTINHGLTPPMENGFQMGLPLVYLTPFMLMGIPWNNGISPSTLRHHGLTPPMDNGIPNNNGIFPSTMGDLQVMSGDVDSLVQVVSQAENSSFQELFPSSQVPLECCTCMMLYGISLKSESSKLHQASKLEFCVVGVFFFRWLLDFDRSAVRRWMIMMVELEITYYTDYTLSIKWISPSLPSVSRVSLLFLSRITCSWVWLVRSYTNRAACGFFNDQDSSIFQSMIVLMAFTSVPCATSRSSTLQSLQRQTFNGLANIRTMKLA